MADHHIQATHWVQCEGCQKWRRITDHYANTIDDDVAWYCESNPDPNFASCSIPQELTDAEIDQETAEANAAAAAAAATDAEPTPPPEGDAEQPNLPKLPAVVQLISENVYSHRKRKQQDEDDIMVCHCPPPWRGGDGCGPNCINRMLCIECTEDFCPCESHCTNQMFTRKQYGKVSVRRAGPKGFGLYADEELAAGQFVIQYVGEVLEEEEYLRRKQYYIQTGQRHYYFMNIGNGEVIDACRKGNVARFINHSCEPNCETQKWMVQGELAIGLFTLRKIKAGEELTFDYNFERYGDKPMRCFCASKRCRKFIGGTQETTANIVELGDADDVTHDPEPVLVREEETDVLVQAMLDKEVGTTQRGWDTKLLHRLQQLCRQKGIDWSYGADEAVGRTASTQAAAGASSPLRVDPSEESSHAAGNGPAAAAAASPASSSAGALGRQGLDGAESSLAAAAARAAKRPPAKRRRTKAEVDPAAAAAAAAKKAAAEERKRQRLLQQQEKRQRQQEAFLRRQQEELARIQRMREQQLQQQQQGGAQAAAGGSKAAKKRRLEEDEDDEEGDGGDKQAAEAAGAAEAAQQAGTQGAAAAAADAGEQQQQLDELEDADLAVADKADEEEEEEESELEDELSSEEASEEPLPERPLPQPSPRKPGLSSRVRVIQGRRSRPPLAPKQQKEEAAAPARRSFLTLAVSAPSKQAKRRSEVDRRLEQLVQKQSWKLKEPSKQSVIKVLRMFNLCDITPRQADAGLLLMQQQQQQPGKAATSPQRGGPSEGDAPPQQQQQQASEEGGGGGAPPAVAVRGGLGGATVVGEEELPALPAHLQPLQALRGAELEARERESEARFRARQRARMADMGMLLDVVLASSSEKLKKEWVDCGILTQLQQALGRLPFSQEYSVVLVKVVAVLEHLPVNSDDLYTMRSAHGTFADLIRRMASSATDWEVRRRAHQLLKRYAASSCSDATLLQLYHLPGPGGKPYLLSLHLPPPQLSRLMALLPKSAPPARRQGRRRGRTPPFRGGPGPGGPAGGPGGPSWFPGPPGVGGVPGQLPPSGGPAQLDPHSSPSTSHGGLAAAAAAGGTAGDAGDGGPGRPPLLQQPQQGMPPWEPGNGLPPPPWAAGGGGGLPPQQLMGGGGPPGGLGFRPGPGGPGGARPPGRHAGWPGPGGPADFPGGAPRPGSSAAGPPGEHPDRPEPDGGGPGRSPGDGRGHHPAEGPWGPGPWGPSAHPHEQQQQRLSEDWEAGGSRLAGAGSGPHGPHPHEPAAGPGAGGGGGAMPFSFRERERLREQAQRERDWQGGFDDGRDWGQHGGGAGREQQPQLGNDDSGRQHPPGSGPPHTTPFLPAAKRARTSACGWQGGEGPGMQQPPAWQEQEGGAGLGGRRSSSKPRITDILDDDAQQQQQQQQQADGRGWRQQHEAGAGWGGREQQLPRPPSAGPPGGPRGGGPASAEDLFVLGVYDSCVGTAGAGGSGVQPGQGQDGASAGASFACAGASFAWQQAASDDLRASTGPAAGGAEDGGSLSPIVSGRFSPARPGSAARVRSPPGLPAGGGGGLLGAEDVFRCMQDPLLASRTPGVSMGACLAGELGPGQGHPRQLQLQQQQQWPDTWDQPGPEFEAFVSDAVKHRLGKYVQPDHPNRITKEEAQSLFRKLRRQVVDKEEAACAERQAAGSFRPIERAKLEANIKEFVRLSIRRMHAARAGRGGGSGDGGGGGAAVNGHHPHHPHAHHAAAYMPM